MTIERSSTQESNSEQLDVAYHHLCRPDRDWVHTKCASDVETQTYCLCFLVIFSFSSLTIVHWRVLMSVSFSLCCFATFHFQLLLHHVHDSFSLLLSLVFLLHFYNLPVCPQSELHINSSLDAVVSSLCVQTKATRAHRCHSSVTIPYIHIQYTQKIEQYNWYIRPTASHSYCTLVNVYICMHLCKGVCASACIGGVNVLLPYATMSVGKYLNYLIWYNVNSWCFPLKFC